MKILAITLLTYLTGNAQTTAPTRINIFNAAAGITVALYTSASPEQPTLIKSRTWVILQPAGDSLGLLINEKPYFIHFEPGKQYYFVAQTGYGSHQIISEKSEREFLLTANINRAKGPIGYTLDRKPN